MKKITLFFIMLGFFITASAQYNFNPIVGPTNVAEGSPVTLNINDVANTAGVPMSSTGTYDSFSVSVDWVDTSDAFSSEADLTFITTTGSIVIDPPTSGSATNGDPATITFEGDLAGFYDPTTDGYIDIVLSQSWGGSSANWSNIVVTLFETPTCVEPSGMSASGVTATTSNLDWIAGDSETEWNIEYSSADFTPGNGEEEGTASASGTPNATLTSLTPATNYVVYYQANCGPGDLSLWVGPFNFTTECVAFTAPFTEDFENAGTIPLCWSMSGGEDWLFSTSADFLDHVGNAGVITGSTASNNYFAYVDSSGDDAPATLTSPLIDVSGLTAPALSFYEISDNEGNANSTLDVEVWDGAAWNNVGTFNTNTSGWELKIIGLSGLTITGDIQVRFIFSETTGDFYDDIAIDDVTIDEAPGCIPPGSLSASNITGTSADISWTSNNGETSWEYVLAPAGTGEPTGPGNTVTTTSVLETTLDFSTSYEVWVRADCGVNGFSDWTGPLVFDTTIQTAFSLDCATDGPLTQDYCYDNEGEDNPVIFTFSSTDGTPLNFNFNSGFIEPNWDELVVLDSDGTPFPGFAPEDDNYGNGGDISGISFQSTGDTISFYINSDGSVSCVTGSFTYPQIVDGINYTVSCATCINPQATYTVVDDCANGDQFLIDVDITDLGDATSLTISNNINGDTTPVTSTGTYQIGPFPFLVDVIVTVSNDQDGNCIINSAPIQLLACPPVNDNPCDATVAMVNDDILCAVSTPGTILAATPSGLPNPSCGGSADDDVWFQFVAQSESHLISLANVNGSSSTDMNISVYEGACDNLTEISCVEGFETWSDVTPSLTIGETYYIRIHSGGSSPENTTFDLCITPYNAPLNVDCILADNYCSGSDASDILYTFNTINTPDLNQGTPGYGVACLGNIPNPTYSVLEIGSTGDILVEIVQNTAFDINDNPIGEELDVDFVLWGPFDDDTDFCALNLEVDCPTCPFDNTTPPNDTFYPFGDIVDCSYSANSTENFTLLNAQEGEIYLLLVTNWTFDVDANENGGIIQVRQTNVGDSSAGSTIADLEAALVSNDVIIDDTNDPMDVDEVSVCGFTSVTLEADSPFADQFIWFEDGIEMPGETSNTLVVTESNNYQVQAFDSQCGADTLSQIVIVNLYEDAGSVDPQNITLCDGADADGSESFDLDALSTSLGLGDGFVVSYYTNQSDANQAMNPVASPYDSSGETLIMRIEDANAASNGFLGCRQLSEVELVVNARPVINQPVDFVVCDDLDGTVDGITAFDLLSINSEISTDPDIVVTYYSTQDNADNAVDALADLAAYSSSGETVFVRAESTTTGCYDTTSFNLEVNVVPLAEFDEQYEYFVCPNATVPVSIGIVPSNFADSDVSVNWLLDGVAIPGGGLTLDSVLLEGDYSAEITFNATGCVNTITRTVEELESCVIPEGISPNNDGINDNFDLSSYAVSKLEIFNRYGTLVYSKSGYTDEWVGQTNDGDELPVGTYFYTMIYDGGKERSDWIYLNK